MRTTVLFLIFLSLALPLHAGWLVPPDAARIRYSAHQDKGHATLDGALKELSDSGRIRRLDGIDGIELFSEETFQQELFAGLERDAPRELKEARESSGNMHNPKMHQLWKPFEKALLATPTIKRLSASLAAHGLTISRVEREKFELRNTIADPKRRFHGFLWLGVSKSGSDGKPSD